MNDERLEGGLRTWLAAEADAARLPDGLRERVAQLEPRPSRHPRAWTWPPRPSLVAAVAGMLVVAIGAGLLASGLLPIGRPDCSGVTFQRVLAAAEAVPGYRYTMEGTELMARPDFSDRESPTFDYSTATFEVSGAYRGPSDWSLEILRVDNPDSLIPPNHPSSLAWLISDDHGWDAYIYVDGAEYARAAGASRYSRLTPDQLNLSWFGASRLTDLLVGGQPIRMSPTGELHEREFEWSVTATDDGCRLTAADPSLPNEPGMVWLNEFDVDPATNLPRRARHRIATPEIPFASGSGASAGDYSSTFTFDYSQVPEIVPPTDPDIPPIDAERAIGDAADAGAGPGGDTASLGRGSSELWLVRGSDGVAILLYEDGLLASSRIVPKSDDVTVEIVDAEQGRFLVLVANELRVSHVRVQLSESDTLQVPEVSSDGRPLAVVDAEGIGDIVTWFAYDENDRELVVNPPPPS